MKPTLNSGSGNSGFEHESIFRFWVRPNAHIFLTLSKPCLYKVSLSSFQALAHSSPFSGIFYYILLGYVLQRIPLLSVAHVHVQARVDAHVHFPSTCYHR